MILQAINYTIGILIIIAIVVFICERTKSSPVQQGNSGANAPNCLDRAEKLAKIFSYVAIPVLVAVGGWYFQDLISKRSVSSEYVKIALEIMRSEKKEDPLLLGWAVDLLAENSPTALPSELIRKFKEREIQLPPNVNLVIFIPYDVQEGDTLEKITQNYVTSVTLMARYGITDDDIVAGTRINNLPVANPAYCVTGRPYAVREGDTVSSIAERFGMTSDELTQMNTPYVSPVSESLTAIFDSESLTLFNPSCRSSRVSLWIVNGSMTVNRS